MSNESVTLLPCPFCGGEANAYVMAGDAVVECKVCSAELAQGVEDEDYHDTSAIIARWNNRSKPVASGAAEMQNAVCQALLDAFPMDDKIADNYAAVAVKALSALLPKATAPVVSEPVAKPYAFEFGKSNGDGTYCVVIERGDEGYVERFAVKDWPIKPLYTSPQPEAVITDEMVEQAARAQCKHGGFDPDEIMANDGPRWRYYSPGSRAALTAALKDGI